MSTGRRTGRDVFGDVALLVFLIAQASDGVLTYVGVSTYGMRIEANPLTRGSKKRLLAPAAALPIARPEAALAEVVPKGSAAISPIVKALPGEVRFSAVSTKA